MGTRRRWERTSSSVWPPCTFQEIAQIPCPSCGMTDELHTTDATADIWHSLQANFAGTALATFGLLFIPWALASGVLRAVRLHSPAGDRRLSARGGVSVPLVRTLGIVVIWQLVRSPELLRSALYRLRSAVRHVTWTRGNLFLTEEKTWQNQHCSPKPRKGLRTAADRDPGQKPTRTNSQPPTVLGFGEAVLVLPCLLLREKQVPRVHVTCRTALRSRYRADRRVRAD